MLALTATAAALAGLRAVRERNPELSRQVAAFVSSLRGEPDPKRIGRAFRLDDGRTAGLKLFYDSADRTDLALVWLVQEGADGPTIPLVAVEAVG